MYSEDRQIKLLILLGTAILLGCFSCPFILEYRRDRIENRTVNGHHYIKATEARVEETEEIL